jgi:hypothetical protein
MTLYFKDFFHPLTFSGSTVISHLLRLIAFQYYFDNLKVAVKIKYKNLVAQYISTKKFSHRQNK